MQLTFIHDGRQVVATGHEGTEYKILRSRLTTRLVIKDGVDGRTHKIDAPNRKLAMRFAAIYSELFSFDSGDRVNRATTRYVMNREPVRAPVLG